MADLGTRKPFHRQRILSLLAHAVAWLWFMSFPLLFMGESRISLGQLLGSWPYWFFCCSFMLLYYVHAYVWLPLAIARKWYGVYILGVLAGAALFLLVLQPFDRLMRLERQISTTIDVDRIPEERPERPLPPRERDFPPNGREGMRPPPYRMESNTQQWDVAAVYIYFMVISLGAMVRVIQYWMASQKRLAETEHERTKTELSFLKAQVHPHFLFNTLNNIYALALTNDPKTPDSLYKLSQLMRYFMDENQAGIVSLQQEVQAIRDYIGLQRLRLGDNCEVFESYHGLEIPKDIAAFVLMPFVENAFKYGVSNTAESLLMFELRVYEQHLTFRVSNTKHPVETGQERSGIGLRNTQRRLEHLYPGHYKLDIDDREERFTVELTLYIA